MQHIDLTDDEDSDLDFTDDSRSRVRKSMEVLKQTRQRRNTEQLDLDYRDNEVINRIQRMKEKSKHIRERRSGSLTNFPISKKEKDSGSLTPSDDELRKLSSKFRKSSLTSPVPQSKKKLLSDSASERETNKKKIVTEKVSLTSKVIKTESEGSSDGEGHRAVNESSPKVIKEQTKTKPISESRPLTIAVETPKKIIKKAETQAANGMRQQDPTPTKSTKQEATQSTSSSSLSKAEIPKEIPAAKSSIQSTPPPPVNWECEHCTFVNESDAKICVICCKTRTEVLKQLPESDDEIDINEINDSILHSESDAKQKGKLRKITFLPGTKAR
jgi:E3 ubiquitin-protein ligase RNF31